VVLVARASDESPLRVDNDQYAVTAINEGIVRTTRRARHARSQSRIVEEVDAATTRGGYEAGPRFH